MSNMSYHIANLLEKMLSTDKDFRFMATNDLMTELQVRLPVSVMGSTLFFLDFSSVTLTPFLSNPKKV